MPSEHVDPAGPVMTPVVAVAASAGGVLALQGFAEGLPVDLEAAVLVVLHVAEGGTSVLPQILARAGRLPARHATDGEPLVPGVILVAPPGRHLLVADGTVQLGRGPRVNGHRPSADILFTSVAERHGRRGAGVVLSGTLDDGALGLRSIGLAGGLTLVQDPDEATFRGMPEAAIAAAAPDAVCAIGGMAPAIAAWLADLAAVTDNDPDEAALDDPSEELSAITCPECGGILSLVRDGAGERFRCRVGHAYSPWGLLAGKQQAVESALWSAVVALEERADMAERVLRRLTARGGSVLAERYRREIAQTTDRAGVLRALIDDLIEAEPLPAGEEAADADAAG